MALVPNSDGDAWFFETKQQATLPLRSNLNLHAIVSKFPKSNKALLAHLQNLCYNNRKKKDRKRQAKCKTNETRDEEINKTSENKFDNN